MSVWYILSIVYDFIPPLWQCVFLLSCVISGIVYIIRTNISHQNACPNNWKINTDKFLQWPLHNHLVMWCQGCHGNCPWHLWGVRDFDEICSRPSECRFRVNKVTSSNTLKEFMIFSVTRLLSKCTNIYHASNSEELLHHDHIFVFSL